MKLAFSIICFLGFVVGFVCMLQSEWKLAAIIYCALATQYAFRIAWKEE